MTTYTIAPHDWWPDTHVSIFADGKKCMGTPKGTEQEMIEHLERTDHMHYGSIIKRLADNDPLLVIANGHAYSIGSANDRPRGFGGTRWFIFFNDGRTVETCSLWHMGDIPARWRDRLPDNARLRSVR